MTRMQRVTLVQVTKSLHPFPGRSPSFTKPEIQTFFGSQAFRNTPAQQTEPRVKLDHLLLCHYFKQITTRI
jgi:hypothetical protein